jgi:hypothetical protein
VDQYVGGKTRAGIDPIRWIEIGWWRWPGCGSGGAGWLAVRLVAAAAAESPEFTESDVPGLGFPRGLAWE